MRKRASAIAWLLAALGLCLSSQRAQAATLTFDLSFEFSGGTAPGGSTPWATATFDDSFGGPNDVRLTMSNVGLVGVEYVTEWYFNFDPTLAPTQLTITPVNVTASNPTISQGANAFQADGDGVFDVHFGFPSGPLAARFTAGEIVVFDLTYTGPIDVTDFNFLSASGGGQGTQLAAAHVEGIGTSGSGDGWIGTQAAAAVPEPASLMLLGTGLLGLGALGVWRRRKGPATTATDV